MRAEVLERITKNANSNSVNLAGMNIEDGEIMEIINRMKRFNSNASTIDLDNNKLGDKGAILLSEHLCDFNNLKELSIQFNDIGKLGATELFGLKKVFSELDILFHGNQITDMGEMRDIERSALSNPIRP